MAKAELEPIASQLRVWLDDSAEYGQPYQFACGVRHLNQHEIELTGVDRRVTRPVWEAIVDMAQRAGIQRILAVKYETEDQILDQQPARIWIDVPSPYQPWFVGKK